MDKQLTFEQSLRSREFEPDGPNYTPRISGVMHVENGNYSYAMSILKSDNGNPDSCLQLYICLRKCQCRERDVSFTPTNVMVIRCQALRDEPKVGRYPG